MLVGTGPGATGRGAFGSISGVSVIAMRSLSFSVTDWIALLKPGAEASIVCAPGSVGRLRCR